ncbi:hypothetical protein [Pseudomonas putida]|uniref:Phage tail protein n=1 Tax=Pseudomonas putida TaxID=303 RepID=A0AAW4BUJ4_PSEPU|nr:hypothetical protein [Pseudomonas putida]MBF8703006.1 hypothetical protein [Pseudomonas putida]MBF8736862.1 hypothetical protein [Pseudomonas putida]
MAKQVINLGTAPSGAGGDDRRSAWLKAINNFNELYAALGAPANGAIPAGIAAAAPIIGDPAAGALMRAGSNSNGYYFQFASGLLICVVAFTGYTSNVVKSVSWPFAFLAGTNVGISASITPSTGYDNSSPTYWGTTSQANFISSLSRAQNAVVITGIGFWK